jgi:hypothetical protein
MDKDGKFKYSSIITVTVAKEKGIYIQPNPASTKITLVYPSLLQTTQASIVNNLGVTVKTLELSAGTTTKEISIQYLAKGWYSLRIVNKKNETQSLTFLKE